jgi:hypothetical protein
MPAKKSTTKATVKKVEKKIDNVKKQFEDETKFVKEE